MRLRKQDVASSHQTFTNRLPLLAIPDLDEQTGAAGSHG